MRFFIVTVMDTSNLASENYVDEEVKSRQHLGIFIYTVLISLSAT